MEVDKGLVKTSDKTSFEGTREYPFKHALLRGTAYETVLLKDRLNLHRQVAEWLLVKSAARMMEYVGLITYHYEKS
jgi:predicted ATPase